MAVNIISYAGPIEIHFLSGVSTYRVRAPTTPQEFKIIALVDSGGLAGGQNIVVTAPINGATTLTLNSNYAGAILIWNGSSYNIIGSH